MSRTSAPIDRTDSARRRGGVPGFVTGARTAWVVVLLAVLFAGLLMGAFGEAERDAEVTDSLPRTYDSTTAAALTERLPEQGQVAIVLFTADSGTLDAGSLPDLGASPPIPSEDGTAALVPVPIEAESATQNADEVEQLRTRLDEATPSGVTAQVTGPAGIEADLAAVFDGANLRLLTVTAAVVALLLIITYRSPVLWLLPLLVVGVADRSAAVLATHVLKALDDAGMEIAWDESTIGILSVLVFGAGTNYALLLISRYRDELRTVEDRREALRTAMRRTAEPVLCSAGTVIVGVLTLALSLIPTTRGLGIACAVGIVVAAAFVLLVLPAALSLVGRWIFWPRVPRVGSTTLEDSRSGWRWIGDRVAARPALVATAVIAFLLLGAANLLRIDLGLDESDQFLDTPEAISAADRIGESFPSGTANPTSILTTSADPAPIAREARTVAGVDSVRRAAAGDGVTEFEVVLAGSSGSAEARASIDGLRSVLADHRDTFVGGAEAEAIDTADAAERDRELLMPCILGLVLLALILLLRALVAPVVLVATVVGSFAAAMGISWLLFTGVFGFDALDDGAPLLAFLFLVALGVDYNIFLVTRAREGTAEYGAREAMLRALAATGGVITSAGILLAAVFAVLGVLPLVVLAQLGVIVCVGVLLDTLLVRTLLVPALALLLGDRFWWPRRVRRPSVRSAG